MIVNINCNIPKLNYKFNTKDSGIVAVYGVSGSGKSCLINALSGFNPNINGEIVFNNNNILLNKKPHKICSMPQDPILFPHWTVEQNLEFALSYSENSNDLLDELLTKLKCEKILNKFPSQLSGGEKQRVALIRTLIIVEKNSLILLDEPFSALDSKMRKAAIELIQEYKNNNLIFFVSHNLADLYRISNDFLYIKHNQVKHNKTTTEIMKTGVSNLPVACKIILGGQQHIIYADNVSISLNENINSSIVYQLISTIKTIKENSDYVIISLETKTQQTLFSKITKQSFKRLGLRLNLTVFANFKASNS